MKKFLAISSVFLMIPCFLTGCGADRNNEQNDASYFDNHDYGRGDGSSVEDRVKDAADGAKDAGKDIVGSAGDAANDIIDGASNAASDIKDGLDGNTENDTRSTTTHTTKVTTKR